MRLIKSYYCAFSPAKFNKVREKVEAILPVKVRHNTKDKSVEFYYDQNLDDSERKYDPLYSMLSIIENLIILYKGR